MELGQKEIELVKELYERLLDIKKSEIDIEYDIKTLENDLAFNYAASKGYKKKDGAIDDKKIKKNLMRDAIKILFLEEKNRLEEKIQILDEYLSDLKSKRGISESVLDSIISSLRELDNLKEDEKLKNEYTGMLDKDVIKATTKLVSMMTKRYKQEKEHEFKEDMGIVVKEREHDDDKLLKDISSKLGIEL